jgi:hypothetical protein
MKGYKTYLLGAIAVSIGVAEFLGMDVVPNIDQSTALNAIWIAIAAMTIRQGSKTDAQTVLK